MITKPDAVIVCVDYWDILSITLPYNRHNFEKVILVTSGKDSIPEWVYSLNVIIHITDDFYANGAFFNKWLPLEQGLEFAKIEWICILDADILIPKSFDMVQWYKDIYDYDECGKNYLFTPYRRMYPELNLLPEELWGNYPLHHNISEFSGYYQLFHASYLGPQPWHETNWKHAGGADTFFQQKWPASHKIRPPFEVLHLGLEGRNWCGRSTPYTNGAYPVDAMFNRNRLAEIANVRRQTGKYDHEKF